VTEEKEKKKNIYKIGHAKKVLTVDDLERLEPGQSMELIFNLKVPETIQKEALVFVPPNESEKPIRKPVKIINKSTGETDHNGVLTLNLKVLN